MESRERIYVTGLGSISALGHDHESVAAGYRHGGTRIRPRQLAGRLTPAAGLAEDSERALAAVVNENNHYRQLDRSVRLAVYAARGAVLSAGWRGVNGVTVIVGSSRGATGLFEKYHTEFLASPEQKTQPLTSPTTTLGNIATWVAQEVQSDGAATELSSTCSTSIYALGSAIAWLRSGMARRVVAGGAEAPLTDFTIAQMRALRIYTNDVDETFPCRPCVVDAGRKNTMVLGEGASMLALERMPQREAERRVASGHGRAGHPSSAPRAGTLVAEVLGAGFSSEPVATNTSLSEEGDCLRRAMRAALVSAELEHVDAIVTHTPGTALGDRAELNAVRRLFGSKLPLLTSNKWVIGHTLGASGALSLEYAIHMLRTQHWLEYPYRVGFSNRPRQLKTVMVNSVGFGGNAGSVILGSVEE